MKACPRCGKRYPGGECFCPLDGTPTVDLDATEPVDPLIGATVDGRYEIAGLLYEGCNSALYSARSIPLEVDCVVKVPLPRWAGEAESIERFVREPRILAAIGSDKVVSAWDAGRLPDGRPYTVLERLRGRTLREILDDDRFVGVPWALEIAWQCCEALTAAHAVGVVHRDLNPRHIHVGVGPFGGPAVKIADFLMAGTDRFGPCLDREGAIFGTAQYTAPEKAACGLVDGRTDVYSLGIVLYEMLCGHVPFEADTFMGVLTKHLYEELIPPSGLVPPVPLPPGVEAIVVKALAKKPERRQQSMNELGEEIRAAMGAPGGEEARGERAGPRREAGEVLCLSHHRPLADRDGAMVCPLCASEKNGSENPPPQLPE